MNSVTWTVRAAGEKDLPFLAEMLVEAVCWRPEAHRFSVAAAMARPDIGHYLEGWPKPGDFGVIACTDRSIGAAWCRQLTATDPGYGYVADVIPEVTIGVTREWRGQGVGRDLLNALIEQAARAGVQSLSLSVEEDNYAVRLYAAAGFRIVRRLRNALTMQRDISASPPAGL